MQLYECGICGSHHPWEFIGDCRESRIDNPDYRDEILTWEERLQADERDDDGT